MDIANLLLEVRNIKNDIIRLRRDFHMHPELGFEEHRTASIIEGVLNSIGIKTQRVASTGIVGLMKGFDSGKTIAFRADMDGLPLVDEKKVEYASKFSGKMHACGHDAHMAILLGTAIILSKLQKYFRGYIKFLFQPAEEISSGALAMIREGVMENPKVDAIFSFHCDIDIESGKIGVIYGKANAASDDFDVVIYGRGSHGAYPHEGIDAITVGANIVSALQNIISREVNPIDPAVITIGTFRGGYQRNIIADKVELSGTIRTLDPTTRKRVIYRINKIIKCITEAFGAKSNIKFTHGCPSLINDNKMIDLVKSQAKQLFGENNVVLVEKPTMGVEDFAYFLQYANGAFYRLGIRNEQKGIIHPHHSNFFDIDEEALPIGVALNAGIALTFLNHYY